MNQIFLIPVVPTLLHIDEWSYYLSYEFSLKLNHDNEMSFNSVKAGSL